MSSPSPAASVCRVADAVVRDRDPTAVDWNWGPGVLMTGMARAADLTGAERYRAFVREWADRHLADLGDRLARGHDYCGYWGPGLAVLQLYEATGEERYGTAARRVVEYALTNGTRLDNGGFAHNGGDYARELWVDTAYMTVPLFSNATRLFGECEYHLESVRQLNAFAAHAQDPRSGLFDHRYDEATDETNGVAWGRGNGWMAMAYAEALRDADPAAWGTRGLAQQFGRLLQGLMAHQGRDGLWHTVVDAPETYRETSGSAMVLFGLAEVHRRDLFTVPYDDLGTTFEALTERIADDGRVGGVSGGTAPGATVDAYDVARGTHSWGTGAFLLAASSYAHVA